jgi:hypothetical protein
MRDGTINSGRCGEYVCLKNNRALLSSGKINGGG